jgi:DNA-binding MurR/RpiR family transcriptional regulator
MRINKKIDELILNTNNSIYLSIARYIKDHRDDFLNNNIKTVAKNCNVSTASITRFCQSLNLKGFNELKYQLNLSKERNIIANDDLGSFYRDYHQLKVFGSQKILGLTKHITLLQELIIKSPKTFIIGFSVSYNATINFVHGMRIFNYQIYLETDPSLIE